MPEADEAAPKEPRAEANEQDTAGNHTAIPTDLVDTSAAVPLDDATNATLASPSLAAPTLDGPTTAPPSSLL